MDKHVEEIKKLAASGNETAAAKVAAFEAYKTARAALGLETPETHILLNTTENMKKFTTEYNYLATVNHKEAGKRQEPRNYRRESAFAALRQSCISASLSESDTELNCSEAVNAGLSDEQLERKARAIAARGKKTVGNCSHEKAARRDHTDERMRRGLK
ncbi:hypothetical protein MSSIH_2004 [Methanosarcina siciliae HI350]|uniref:Uncharacterized protein n=1 Tax=Methanosarcina siciliae HI350 TaxID=1434119 RepID=A0A0E3PEL6_9EURY|nr:hypothetical protein [Methanosarcina siciliae]AKB32694.1 hypothetical protein MSSIH_2004 [Methanosarcina siciliae HI350]